MKKGTVIVIDTNVLVSAFHFGGSPEEVFSLVREGEIEMFISPFILDEFERVLREKFKWSAQKIKQTIRKIEGVSTMVDPQMKVEAIKGKDSDNRILECALEAKAEYLITGDTKHLQPLKQYKGVKILSPERFLSL